MRARSLVLVLLLLSLPVLGSPGRRTRRGLRAEGGGGTQSVTDIGLDWLAARQKPDGRWDAEGEMGPQASTGLVLLAFLGAGETHKTGQYCDNVKRALVYLGKSQGPDGSFATSAGKPIRDHAIATLAMTEAYALTGSPLFLPSAQQAVDRLAALRHKTGGWGPDATSPPDTETTAWACAALKSAKMAGGIRISAGAFASVRAYLDRVTGTTGAVPPRAGEASDLVSTARAMMARIHLGEDTRGLPQTALLLKNLPAWDETPGKASHDSNYWYWGSMAMFQAGGDPWKAWNTAMKSSIIDHQRKDGDLRGSWDPAGPWAKRAGRVAATALHTMCLETYYRYPRVFGGGPGGFAGRGDAGARPSTGGTREPNGNAYGDVFFRHHGVNPFVDTEDDRLSTFAIDVDTASYAVTRRYLRDGNLPDPASVRVEEFVNAFPSDDAPPKEGTFRLVAEGMPSRFGGPRYHLLRLGLRAKDVAPAERKAAKLTFVVDVSGSMDRENRLELVKRSLRLLVSRLRTTDEIALVIYGSEGRALLRHTTNHDAILGAIERLAPGGSTNAEEGLRLGYREARAAFAKAAVSGEKCTNRLILCSDGVANVGRTDGGAILKAIGEAGREGISLTTIGFGMGNYNDVMMEKLADTGDGSYAYVDTIHEARRIFLENLEGVLQTVAKDTKVQVEFDPAVVARWRLLGYENRDVADEDFRVDDVDAGEVGAGQTVTALYEIKLRREAKGARIGTFRVRYRLPDEDRVVEEAVPMSRTLLEVAPSRQLRRCAAVAEFAEILRESYWARDGSLEAVRDSLKPLVAEFDHDTRIVELLGLVGTAAGLKVGEKMDPPPEERPEIPRGDGER